MLYLDCYILPNDSLHGHPTATYEVSAVYADVARRNALKYFQRVDIVVISQHGQSVQSCPVEWLQEGGGDE